MKGSALYLRQKANTSTYTMERHCHIMTGVAGNEPEIFSKQDIHHNDTYTRPYPSGAPYWFPPLMAFLWKGLPEDKDFSLY